jgi:hypothetical protein
MTVNDLNIGDVFRVLDHASVRPELHWRKETPTQARPAGLERHYGWLGLAGVKDCAVELVERASTAPIRRMGNSIVLRDGEIVLGGMTAFRVHRCTPGEKFTDIVLAGTSFGASRTHSNTPGAALGFVIKAGAKALGRPANSEVIAHAGRVYARATSKEVTGKARVGGYKRFALFDGVRRMVIAGLLVIPDDPALFDIIQEQFVEG